MSPTWRRALLLGIPLAPLAELLPMVKPEPLIPGLAVTALVLIGGVASPGNRVVGRARLAVLGALVCLGFVVVWYGLLVAVVPPVSGDGHAVMPLGQALAAFALGPPSTLCLLAVYVRRLGREPRVESLLLAAAAVVAALAAIWARLGGASL
jgi:hypothetical protein